MYWNSIKLLTVHCGGGPENHKIKPPATHISVSADLPVKFGGTSFLSPPERDVSPEQTFERARELFALIR